MTWPPLYFFGPQPTVPEGPARRTWPSPAVYLLGSLLAQSHSPVPLRDPEHSPSPLLPGDKFSASQLPSHLFLTAAKGVVGKARPLSSEPLSL